MVRRGELLEGHPLHEFVTHGGRLVRQQDLPERRAVQRGQGSYRSIDAYPALRRCLIDVESRLVSENRRVRTFAGRFRQLLQ